MRHGLEREAPGSRGPIVSTSEAIFARRIERERTARIAAERLLEEKSRDLYEINKSLREWTAMLEEIVTERTAELTKALEETQDANTLVEHQALHDPLTGLANRRYLRQVLLDIAKARDQHKEIGTAVFHIDLDRFKQINDTRGHAAGDFILIHTAAILKSLVRTGDFLARIGGDEFVIVARSDGNTRSLAALASRITEELSKPVLYMESYCRFGASIGIAYSRSKTTTPSKLLVNADIALYRAKKAGRGRYAFFSSALQKEILEAQTIAEDILIGLDQGEFFPIYQPQFDAATHEIVGVEALVRWNHRDKGILYPAQFLKIAEDIKVIDRIDNIVLERGLGDILSFRQSGVIIPRLSVNISSQRLNDPNLTKILKDYKLPKKLVAFELVESIFLDDIDAKSPLSRTIKQLKRLGIDIEIDDFGTGHASIVGLLRVNPTRLKIARELVMPIIKSRKQRRLLQSIIEMGKALGIEIVAEGVESWEHAEILRELGCDYLQGYALAMPMTAPRLFQFIRTGAWRTRSDTPPEPELDIYGRNLAAPSPRTNA
jgi:diguanylate cyclase (GGDEF)-like protein